MCKQSLRLLKNLPETLPETDPAKIVVGNGKCDPVLRQVNACHRDVGKIPLLCSNY